MGWNSGRKYHMVGCPMYHEREQNVKFAKKYTITLGDQGGH